MNARPIKRTARTLVNLRPTRFKSTARDLWILESLAKMRFLSTSQLAKLFFKGSRWSANKGLRRLLNAGLVKVWLRSLHQDNVYSLTSAGKAALIDKNDRLGVRTPRELDGNLDHLLAINDVRIALALDLAKADGELIWWHSDWELRAQARYKVIPDALFKLSWSGAQESIYALELDNNSKSQNKFLRKILRYVNARGARSDFFSDSLAGILVVGRNGKWLEKYRQRVAHTCLDAPIWFAPLRAVKLECVVSSIWTTSCSSESHSLRDIQSFLTVRKGKWKKT